MDKEGVGLDIKKERRSVHDDQGGVLNVRGRSGRRRRRGGSRRDNRSGSGVVLDLTDGVVLDSRSIRGGSLVALGSAVGDEATSPVGEVDAGLLDRVPVLVDADGIDDIGGDAADLDLGFGLDDLDADVVGDSLVGLGIVALDLNGLVGDVGPIVVDLIKERNALAELTEERDGHCGHVDGVDIAALLFEGLVDDGDCSDLHVGDEAAKDLEARVGDPGGELFLMDVLREGKGELEVGILEHSEAVDLLLADEETGLVDLLVVVVLLDVDDLDVKERADEDGSPSALERELVLVDEGDESGLELDGLVGRRGRG